MIKKSFMAGLACLLPLVLTVWLSFWFIKLITRPFESMASSGVALLLLVAFIIFVGFIGERLVVHYILRIGHLLLKKTPIIGKVYKSLSDVTNMVLAPKGQSFTEVVWIPFWDGRMVIGLVAHENSELVSVFVPGALNSAFGFVVLVERATLMKCEMTVEEAVRYQVSCGMIGTGMTPTEPVPVMQ